MKGIATLQGADLSLTAYLYLPGPLVAILVRKVCLLLAVSDWGPSSLKRAKEIYPGSSCKGKTTTAKSFGQCLVSRIGTAVKDRFSGNPRGDGRALRGYHGILAKRDDHSNKSTTDLIWCQDIRQELMCTITSRATRWLDKLLLR